MHDTLAPWTGDPFPMPAPQAAPPPLATGRTRRWSIEVGREGLAICSTVEDHRPRAVAPIQSRPTLALTLSAVACGFALMLVGASAGRAWSPAPVTSDAAMVVPAAKPVPVPTATARAIPENRAAIGRAFPSALPKQAEEETATTPIGLSRTEAVARALSTGEFQEWTAADGTTGFAVAGPAEVTPQGSCRALAVLTRKADGSDSVASSRECRAEPTKD